MLNWKQSRRFVVSEREDFIIYFWNYPSINMFSFDENYLTKEYHTTEYHTSA